MAMVVAFFVGMLLAEHVLNLYIPTTNFKAATGNLSLEHNDSILNQKILQQRYQVLQVDVEQQSSALLYAAFTMLVLCDLFLRMQCGASKFSLSCGHFGRHADVAAL